MTKIKIKHLDNSLDKKSGYYSKVLSTPKNIKNIIGESDEKE